MVGEEQHARAHGVELLRQAVEHGEGEGVAERVEQPVLDDDGHGPGTPLAQRARQGIRARVGQLGGGGLHALGRGRCNRALPLKTSEAVLIETPASAATSRRVTLRV